jgi:hypothetical protein
MKIKTHTNYQGKKVYTSLNKEFQVGNINEIVMTKDSFYNFVVYSTCGWNFYDLRNFSNGFEAKKYFRELFKKHS